MSLTKQRTGFYFIFIDINMVLGEIYWLIPHGIPFFFPPIIFHFIEKIK